MTSISVIICTKNRASNLRETLRAMARVRIPCGVAAELVVVDNGSSDQTKQVVRSNPVGTFGLHYVYEPRRGKSHALNSGVEKSTGSIMLFTDDDVCPDVNWMEGMSTPILEGRAEAVAGGVTIAPHLHRPWMEPFHRALLASTEELDQRKTPNEIFGVNMAISREVLQKVPRWDPEIGAGMELGHMEDILFSKQLLAAGYRLLPAFEVRVEHHFDEDRLLRASFLRRAVDQGRSLAYLIYHWQHQRVKHPLLRWWKRTLDVQRFRLLHSGDLTPEGISAYEFAKVSGAAFARQYYLESKRLPNYDRFGLVKRSAA
jgi:GT2 family glycosyltransferase